MEYIMAKWLHILSSTLLFGTGIGTAYYMICASRTRNPPIVAAVGKNVVTADCLPRGYPINSPLDILVDRLIRYSRGLLDTGGVVANKNAAAGG